MKKIFSFLLVTVLSFGTAAFAQDVQLSKDVTGPDGNGVYTLTLDAFVTGSVSVTNTPADIVLLLDYSSSMWSEIDDLRASVANFVKTIQASNANVTPDENGGHRVALVLFAGNVFPAGRTVHVNRYRNYNRPGTYYEEAHDVTYSSALCTLLDVDDLVAGTTTVSYEGSDMIGCPYESGTNSPDAMKMGRDILAAAADAGDYTNTTEYPDNSKRARVVVMFTDGEPYIGSEDRRPAMNSTITYAWDIKNPNSAYKGMVYSVGLFHDIAEGTANQTTTYMSYMSSDYSTSLVTIPANNPTYVPVSGEYSIIVNNSSQLEKIFKDLANIAGGDYSASSASSVLVDVVTTSFLIPKEADLGSVTVWKVPCTKSGPTSMMNFDSNRSHWTDITDDVELTTDFDTGMVSVTGYDYGDEWCGWDASANNNTGAPHGHKLLLEIPIMANTNAVGGFNIQTNGEGSTLTIRDEEENVIATYSFVSPKLSLPVNIHIMKKGLGSGESAKFTIKRTTLPVTSSSKWDYVTSVFVTNGASSSFEVAKDDNKSYPVTYVRGLPSATTIVDPEDPEQTEVKVGYVYKIIEDDWSWSYSFSKVTGLGADGSTVTIEDKDNVLSDQFATNPIIFWNTKETSVDARDRLHAESKSTNIFETGSSVKYDDSKTNTGTGR